MNEEERGTLLAAAAAEIESVAAAAAAAAAAASEAAGEEMEVSATNVTSMDSLTPTQPSYLGRILPSVVAMSLLFALSAVGNVTVFLALVTSRSRKTRISVIILHLTIADLFVTFILIPTEVRESFKI